MTDVNISPLSVRDLPEVLEIERASFSDPWSEGLFAEELDGDHRRLNAVLRLRGRVVAYTLGWIVEDEFHLGNIAVRAEYRGQGYGAKLLEHILNQAQIRGCRLATLEVRASNLPAQKLYRRFGFKEIAIRRRYYGDEDALVMMAAIGQTGNVAD